MKGTSLITMSHVVAGQENGNVLSSATEDRGTCTG